MEWKKFESALLNPNIPEEKKLKAVEGYFKDVIVPSSTFKNATPERRLEIGESYSKKTEGLLLKGSPAHPGLIGATLSGALSGTADVLRDYTEIAERINKYTGVLKGNPELTEYLNKNKISNDELIHRISDLESKRVPSIGGVPPELPADITEYAISGKIPPLDKNLALRKVAAGIAEPPSTGELRLSTNQFIDEYINPVLQEIRPAKGIVQNVAQLGAHLGTSIVGEFIPVGAVVGPPLAALGTTKHMFKLQKALSLVKGGYGTGAIVSKIIAPHLPEMLKTTTVLTAVGGIQGLKTGTPIRSAIELGAFGPVFTLTSIPASRLIRAVTSATVMGGVTAVGGGSGGDIAHNAILFGMLGLVSPSTKTRLLIEAEKGESKSLGDLIEKVSSEIPKEDLAKVRSVFIDRLKQVEFIKRYAPEAERQSALKAYEDELAEADREILPPLEKQDKAFTREKPPLEKQDKAFTREKPQVRTLETVEAPGVAETKKAKFPKSGYSPHDNLFNNPSLRENTSYGWRSMGAKEIAKLLSGQKIYTGEAAATKGNFLAAIPESASQYGGKNRYLVEFGGVRIGRDEGLIKGFTATKDNITMIWKYDTQIEDWIEIGQLRALSPEAMKAPQKPSIQETGKIELERIQSYTQYENDITEYKKNRGSVFEEVLYDKTDETRLAGRVEEGKALKQEKLIKRKGKKAITAGRVLQEKVGMEVELEEIATLTTPKLEEIATLTTPKSVAIDILKELLPPKPKPKPITPEIKEKILRRSLAKQGMKPKQIDTAIRDLARKKENVRREKIIALLSPEEQAFYKATLDKASKQIPLTPAEYEILERVGVFKKLAEGETSSELPFEEEYTTPDDLKDGYEITKLYSGFPADEVYQAIKPFMDVVISKARIGAKDVSLFMRRGLRLPFWSERFYFLSESLHRLTQEGLQISGRVRHIAEEGLKYHKIPVIWKQISTLLLKGDELGKVFSADEMNAAKISPEAQKGYRAIRLALDWMQRKMLAKFYGESLQITLTDKEGAKTLNLSTEDYKSGGLSLRNVAIDKLSKEFAEKHSLSGYFPRYRFGRFLLVIKDVNEKTQEIVGFDSIMEAERAKKSLPVEDIGTIWDTKHDKAEVASLLSMGRLIPTLRELMKKQGMPDRVLSDISKMIGDEYFKRSLGGRLARRKTELIPGYSTDVYKAFLTYADSYPLAVVKRFRLPFISKLVRAIPEKSGDRVYASNLVDYFYSKVQREGEVNMAARKGIYMHYLVLKPAFAIVNLTQRYTMTLPWAISIAGKDGARAFKDAQVAELRLIRDFAFEIPKGKKAIDVIMSRDYLTWEQKWILNQMTMRGELQALRQIELGITGKIWKGLDVFGFVSEKSNRIHAALTALDIFHKQGLKGQQLINSVDTFVNRTQNMYSKANRPEWARGWKAPVFVFKTYMLNYLNMYHTLLKQGIRGDARSTAGFAVGMATMLALGGVLGSIPQELEGIVDWFMLNVAKDYSWPIAKRDAKRSIDGKTAGILLHGLPALLGIEGSYAVGFPDITSTAIFPMAKGLWNLPSNLAREDVSVDEKWKIFIPKEFQKLIQLWKLNKAGNMPVDMFGKPLLSIEDIRRMPPEIRGKGLEYYLTAVKATPMDKFVMAFGFPTRMSYDYYSDIRALQMSAKSIRRIKAELNIRMAKAISSGDMKEVNRVLADATKRKVILNTSNVLPHLRELDEVKMRSQVIP